MANTSLIGLTLPTTGSLSGTWGDTVNNAISQIVDVAVAGTQTISADADITLTLTTGSASSTGLTANSSQYAVILWTAAGTVTRTITVPAQSKTYVVINKSSTQSITVQGVTGSGVTLAAGTRAIVAWDGTNFVNVGVGSAAGSNTQVQFNSSGAFGASSALTWDGTSLSATKFAGALNGTVGATTASTGAFTTVTTTSPIAYNYGGTGQSSAFTQYGVTYASTTTALATTAVGTTGQVLTANTGAAPTFQTPAAGVSLSANNTWTGTQTFNGSSSIFGTVLLDSAETVNVVASAPSSTTNFYVQSGSVQYYTTSAANNWTLNIAFSSGTSLNTALSTGQSVTFALVTTQGSTAYYNSAVTIDGTSVTPKWIGGAPTAGNASGLDVYRFAVIKTASATYTVLASLTQYK